MKIFNLDSTLYRALDKSVDFLFLGVLWCLSCIPIVTIFPATAAMFGVVRKWVRKEDAPVFGNFVAFLKEDFLKRVLLGIVWLIILYVLYLNITLTLEMTGVLKVFMLSALMSLCVLFVISSLLIFPIMVHYSMGLADLLKNSLLLSVVHLKITFMCMVTLLITVFVIYIMPISIFFISSVAAYILYRLCHQLFKRIEMMREEAMS